MSNVGRKKRSREENARIIKVDVDAGIRCPDCWAPWDAQGHQVQREDAPNYGDPCINVAHVKRTFTA